LGKKKVEARREKRAPADPTDGRARAVGRPRAAAGPGATSDFTASGGEARRGLRT